MTSCAYQRQNFQSSVPHLAALARLAPALNSIALGLERYPTAISQAVMSIICEHDEVRLRNQQ